MKFEQLNGLETLEVKASPVVLSVGSMVSTTALLAVNADDDDPPPQPEPAPPPDPGDDDPVDLPVPPPSGPAGPGK